MMFLIALISLLLAQTDTRMTVEDCLFKNAESTRITEPSLVANLSGRAIPQFMVELILPYRYSSGHAVVQTDTGPRMIWLYQHWSGQYLFVFRHENAPGAREGTAWHGACMLRLG